MTQNKTKLIFALVLLMVGLLITAQAKAAPATGTAATASSGGQEAPSLFDPFHHPTDWLEMGADFRFRYHYGENWAGLDEDVKYKGKFNNRWNFERYRTRWWTTIKLDEDTTINTRFTWEFRTYDAPPSKPQSTDFDEIIMDNLNFKQRNFLGLPVTAIIGRQDIFLGQGWLVADGTPQDGSRTFYFDAARFTVDLCEKTKMDLIYIRNMPNSDWWLKPINDRNKYVTQEEEQGAILYLTDKSLDNTQLEGYFMYKNNNPVNPTFGKAFNFPQTSVNAFSKKEEIYTFGGAVTTNINDNWNYRVEGAVQTGRSESPNATITPNHKEEELLALGGKANLEYCFKDDYDNKLHVTFEDLSGDNPNTDRVTSFNPLWGQWPQWSELLQGPYVNSMEDSLISNVQRFAIGHKFKPNNQWEILTDYHWLWANQNTYAGNPKFTNDGNFRGQLLTCWARYNFTKQLKGNLVFEYFMPGNYYAQANRDNAVYFHWTVEYTF